MKKPLWLILWLLLAAALHTHAATISIQAADATRYDTWLPEKGNTLTLLVSVTGAPSEGELQFRFTEVSNWPGDCMNAPLNAPTAGSKQDLCIYGQVHDVYTSTANALAGSPLSLPTDTLKNGHIAWETRADGRTPARFSWNSEAQLPTDFTIAVIVTSEDYGAFGTLQAHLYQKDTVDETALLNIPKDNNNNKIADAWEVADNGWKAGMTATTDDEPSGIAGNSYTGDGFTTFEEYRGFEVNGVHKRLNLKRKDIFVHSEFDETFYPQLPPEDRVRLGRATDANGEPQNGFPSVFKVWFIAQTEMDSDRVVNVNECYQISRRDRSTQYKYWVLSQKAVQVLRDDRPVQQVPLVQGNPNPPLGFTQIDADCDPSTTQYGGVPHKTDWARIYIRAIKEDLTVVSYTDTLKTIVAHEFAHTVGLADHRLTGILQADPNNTSVPLR